MAVISAYKCDDYDLTRVTALIRKQFDDTSLNDALRSGMRVVIKPNLLSARKPELAVTTHPAVLRGLINVLRERGITDITIAESSGGPYTDGHMSTVYNATGISSLADICVLNRDMSYTAVHTAPGSMVPEFNILTPIAKADAVIDVAKLKTHGMTRFSAGMKNLFGCVPGLQKPEMHMRYPEPERFCRMICELDETVKPVFTLIDAIDCMEGNGPGGGTVRHYGALLASRDVYALDRYAVTLMGYRPDALTMLNTARELKLLTDAPDEFKGDALIPADPPFRLPDTKKLDFTGYVPGFLAPVAKKILNGVLRPLPKVDSSKCVGCGRCAESCPMHIIEITGRKANIPSHKKCISCFCCQEMCPVKAIYVKRLIR